MPEPVARPAHAGRHISGIEADIFEASAIEPVEIAGWCRAPAIQDFMDATTLFIIDGLPDKMKVQNPSMLFSWRCWRARPQRRTVLTGRDLPDAIAFML